MFDTEIFHAPLVTPLLIIVPSFTIGPACFPALGQQKTTASGSPLEMRLCVDNSCEKLVWRGTYYDGIKDKGSDTLPSPCSASV
jgi:hypothetical protein